ncbi:MAG: CBS domain-containing protein [Chloroflexi bacterium]|nr:CBS domain-containing protein [Chloroflexota bacterium]
MATTPPGPTAQPATPEAPPGSAPSVVADLMDRSPPTVPPTATVGEVARILLQHHLSGVPVVSVTGEVLGVVTQADLVARHAHVHFPFYLSILGGWIPLTGEHHFQEEFRRITGRTAADIMTTKPYMVGENAALEDVATRMAENGIDSVVVVRGRRLVGLLARADLVRLVAIEETGSVPPES